MLMVVWRANGVDFDVDAFLEKFAMPIDKPWRRGEKRFNRIMAESGMSGCLYNGEACDEGLEAARRFAVEWRQALDELARQDVRVVIDLGMSVVDEVHFFTRCIRLMPADLRLFGEANVAFEVSAYASGPDRSTENEL